MPAVPRSADASDAGRSCPYCRFPLKGGSDAVECGDCHAVHHADCWAEGQGCAVVGCAGAADAATVVAAAPGPGAYAPPTGPPAPPPSGRPAGPVPTAPGRSPWLTVSIVLLALVIAGTGAAFLLLGGDDPAPAAATAASATAARTDGATTVPATTTRADAGATPTATTASAPATTTGPTGTASTPAADPIDDGALPNVSRAEMSAEVTTLLRDFHEAIVDGDYRTAWGLLSDRRRAYEEADAGYDGWTRNQQTVANGIGNPRSIRARVVSVDRADSSVQVDVSGPSYSGGGCSSFRGRTWARYEHGAWHYDPGYAIAGRRTVWEPRKSELLLVC
ncbi:RING finger protein [Patulibacter sp. NPDC049589]|uniref:RING finger protein n=1 Tax=Patulibacter sp. NPDC049589 TaxID=3154731 RepID=UPI00343A9AA8